MKIISFCKFGSINILFIKKFSVVFSDHADDTYISFDDAATVLRQELNYPEDRALHFVRLFDHNGDGRLSAAEFTQFRKKVEET